MPETNEKVLAMIGRELSKNASVSNAELFDKAVKMDPSIGGLSRREFHARYPLQWKRRRAQGLTGEPAAVVTERKPAARPAAAAPGKRPRGRPRKQPQTVPTPEPAAAPSRAPVPAAASLESAGIRRIMLQFASDVAGAESRRDHVKVLADIDKYVDRVTKAAAGG
jgi:hypothetical protein